jgi:hypothetical protein
MLKYAIDIYKGPRKSKQTQDMPYGSTLQEGVFLPTANIAGYTVPCTYANRPYDCEVQVYDNFKRLYKIKKSWSEKAVYVLTNEIHLLQQLTSDPTPKQILAAATLQSHTGKDRQTTLIENLTEMSDGAFKMLNNKLNTTKKNGGIVPGPTDFSTPLQNIIKTGVHWFGDPDFVEKYAEPEKCLRTQDFAVERFDDETNPVETKIRLNQAILHYLNTEIQLVEAVLKNTGHIRRNVYATLIYNLTLLNENLPILIENNKEFLKNKPWIDSEEWHTVHQQKRVRIDNLLAPADTLLNPT